MPYLNKPSINIGYNYYQLLLRLRSWNLHLFSFCHSGAQWLLQNFYSEGLWKAIWLERALQDLAGNSVCTASSTLLQTWIVCWGLGGLLQGDEGCTGTKAFPTYPACAIFGLRPSQVFGPSSLNSLQSSVISVLSASRHWLSSFRSWTSLNSQTSAGSRSPGADLLYPSYF